MTPEETKFGVEEAAFINNATNAWFATEGEFECSDNFRLCRIGDLAGEAEYEDARNDGCCGFIDIEIGPSPAGHKYRYGFNYGH